MGERLDGTHLAIREVDMADAARERRPVFALTAGNVVASRPADEAAASSK